MKIHLHLLLAITLCAFMRANAQIDLAVLNLDSGVGLNEESVNGLQEMLTTELHNSRLFNIKERNHTSDIWNELSRKKGTTLTIDEIKSYGQKLGVDAILVGMVNYQVRERSLEEVQTGISHGEYNVDVRIVSITTGSVLSTGGDVQKSNETTRSLMNRIANQLVDNYIPDNIPDNNNSEPVTLLGYLKAYPHDLGIFTSSPQQFIEKINRQNMYGHNDWRLPSSEELDLLLSNKYMVGLRGNKNYGCQQSIFSSSNPLAVRLVRSKVITPTIEKESSNPYILPSSKNWGTVPLLKREVTTDFKIINPTSETIYIKQIKCASSNIKIAPYPTYISSGESVKISVTVQTAKRQGVELHRDIKIYLKDYEPLTFKISMKVE